MPAVNIPISRIVVQQPDAKSRMQNSPSNGVWSSHASLPFFRVLNQTLAG